MTELFKRWFQSKTPFPVAPPQPIELKRGGLYVIEATAPMTGESFTELSGYLAKFGTKTGCEFLILDYGFKIATTADSQFQVAEEAE